MESDWRDHLMRRAIATFDHLARSEQSIRNAAELLGRLHWHGSTMEAQMRQAQPDWSIPEGSEVDSALLYFPGRAASE